MLFKEKFEREKKKEVKNKRRESRKSEKKGNTSRDTIVSVVKVSIEFLDGKYLKVLPFFLRPYLFFFHILVYQQIHVLRSYSIILLRHEKYRNLSYRRKRFARKRTDSYCMRNAPRIIICKNYFVCCFLKIFLLNVFYTMNKFFI